MTNVFAAGLRDVAALGLTTTENGLLMYRSSGNKAADFMNQTSSARSNVDNLVKSFKAAYQDNPTVAMILLFNMRDVRQGAGERAAFNAVLRELAKSEPRLLVQLIPLIAEYGRFTDLLELFELEHIGDIAALVYARAITKDQNGLAAKWAPRKGERSKKLRLAIDDKMSLKEYRKLIVSLSDTVEQKLCAKQFDQIDYNKVPSLAMNRYYRVFERHDEARYNAWKERLAKGEGKVNASVLYPHQVLTTSQSDGGLAAAQWNALPELIPENVSIFPMVDVSGSMYTNVADSTALDIAVVLGMYISEKQKSCFENLILTFSANPQIYEDDPSLSLSQRYSKMCKVDWGMNTNLFRAFSTLLAVAVANKASPEEMPDYMLILSDMQFDDATHDSDSGKTAMQKIDAMYAERGYKRPNIIFWNLCARAGSNGAHATSDESGTATIGGFSPNILKHVLSGDLDGLSTEAVIDSIINDERYAPILDIMNKHISN